MIDAPEGSEAVVQALEGRDVDRIVVTHSHADHWNGFDELRKYTDSPVFASEKETNLNEQYDIQALIDGEIFKIGDATAKIIHTPGHTPGSICIHIGSALLTGDTLFPGGPGRTRSADLLNEEINSITNKLYKLPDETLVLPGHGNDTTIALSKEEYAIFASKTHDPDLHGDVAWLES
ncbi:MAG: MBL fold metallo-hydrolase [Dehalococcoidia bacterium]|nr:MBL fold metallo-hydrolase [Dehalococcoidia bacterium]